MDETTELYQQACEYAKGFSHDAKIFTGAMFVIMRDRIWEKGWVDQVHHTTIKTPTLRAFIERPMPKGIGQSVEWTYAALKTGLDLGDKDAEEAINLLNTQIESEGGKTAEAIYLRKTREVVSELPEPMSPDEAGAKGGRGNKAMSNRQSFSGTTAAYLLARLKRDHPKLAERVVNGELSANAAAIEAGFRKKLTPFEQVMKLIPKLTATERRKIKNAL